MSGGVDSGVAACLLHEQGYDVVGVFMRLGAENAVVGVTERRGDFSLPISSNALPDRHRGCCSAADATDARLVAGMLGIPFYALNFEEDFSRLIDYFADEYAKARTPNPCVRCNQWLKFGRLVEYADAIGADWIATGHYAKTVHSDGGTRLCRARDARKDQSYVLFGVPPDVLSRTLFPLGDMTKAEVRDVARRRGLALHDKPESQDICFVPDRAYERIVRHRRPDAFADGEIRHTDGRVLGRHEGLPNFTIGQRRGLRVAVGSPVYVADLDESTGTVTVGPAAELMSPQAHVANISWLRPPTCASFRASVQIRYNHVAADAAVSVMTDSTQAVVQFDEPQWAVTPGQAAVFFDGDEVLGGGWIEKTPRDDAAD
jgi:tRNA-specific 2-thiouridylase